MNKRFLFLFSFLIIGIIIISNGVFAVVDCVDSPYSKYICESLPIYPKTDLDSVLKTFGLTNFVKTQSYCTSNQYTCESTPGCKFVGTNCKPVSYCDDVSDCFTGTQLMKNFEIDENILYLLESKCENNKCYTSDQIVYYYPKSKDISVSKFDFLNNSTIYNYLKNSGFLLDLYDICKNNTLDSTNWDGVVCDVNHYVNNLDDKNKLSYFWPQYFVTDNLGAGESVAGDVLFNNVFAIQQSDLAWVSGSDVYYCSPSKYFDSINHNIFTIDGDINLTKPLIDNNYALFFNGLTLPLSSCSKYNFSCPCVPDNNECHIQGCSATSNWICNANKLDNTSCMSGKGKCVSGACIPYPDCVIPAQCPAPTNKCLEYPTCTSGKCVYQNTPFGVSCGSGLTCDGFGQCNFPANAPSICKIRSESDGNYLECNITTDLVNYLDLSKIDFINSGLKKRVYINFMYDGDSIIRSLYADEDINYVFSSLDTTKKNTVSLSDNHFAKISNLNFDFFNGNIDLKTTSVTDLNLLNSNIGIYKINGIDSLKVIHSDLNISYIANTTIHKININNNVINNISIYSNKITIDSQFNLTSGIFKVYSQNGSILELSGTLNNVTRGGKINVNELILNNTPLTLNLNSYLSNNGNKLILNASGPKSIVYFNNISQPIDMNLAIYSESNKSAIIDINNIILNSDTNFYFSPLQTGVEGQPYYIKIRNVSGNKLLNIFYTYDLITTMDKSDYIQLLDIDRSKNINIFGPVFDDAEYFPMGKRLFNIGSDVNNLSILNFKYYSNDPTIKRGTPIVSASPIVINNSVINNCETALTFYISKSQVFESLIYNNSFSNNAKIFYSGVNDNNIYFFNNFLNDNSCLINDSTGTACKVSKTKLKLLSKNDTNNSFGASNNCNWKVDNSIIEYTLKQNYKTIPIFYYSSTNVLVSDYYTPICYGGNLYSEKNKSFNCKSNCFEDGLDVDGVAEIGSIWFTTPYNGFDFAPLVYSGYISDWNILIGSNAFNDYNNLIYPIFLSECNSKSGTLSFNCSNCSDTSKYFSGSDPSYKYVPWNYKLSYLCKQGNISKFNYDFNVTVSDLLLDFYQVTRYVGQSKTILSSLDKNSTWRYGLSIPKLADLTPKNWQGIVDNNSKNITIQIGFDNKNRYLIGEWEYKVIPIINNNEQYSIGPFYIFANQTDSSPKHVVDSLPISINSPVTLDVLGINNEYYLDENIDSNIILKNLSTNLSGVTKLTIQIYSGTKKVYDINYDTGYLTNLETKTQNFTLPISSFTTKKDDYSLRIIENFYGLTYNKEFRVLDHSDDIKTVKTPDNSVYVILLLVATTIGLLIYRNRN